MCSAGAPPWTLGPYLPLGTAHQNQVGQGQVTAAWGSEKKEKTLGPEQSEAPEEEKAITPRIPPLSHLPPD